VSRQRSLRQWDRQAAKSKQVLRSHFSLLDFLPLAAEGFEITMSVTATFKSTTNEAGTTFHLKPARASVGYLIFGGLIVVIVLFNALGAFASGTPLGGVVMLALAGLPVYGISKSLSGRSAQTLIVDAQGIRSASASVARSELAEVSAFDPSANTVIGSYQPVMVSSHGGGATGAVATAGTAGFLGAMAAGQALAARQQSRNVSIVARKHGGSERLVLATGLTGETAVALVDDIGRALTGKMAITPPPQAAFDPATSDKIYPDSPAGWRSLMAEAERRGWTTATSLSGVSFHEPATGRMVSAVTVRDARIGLGF
jgi:hypothetical protein